MPGTPVGGFSIIIYSIILLGRLLLAPFGRNNFIRRLLYSLIDKEHDGPLRRTFAYVLAGTIAVYLGSVLIGIVTMGFLAAPSFTIAADGWTALSHTLSEHAVEVQTALESDVR